ncbi:cutinase-domain-containing protein, partial [Tothia fuscella]
MRLEFLAATVGMASLAAAAPAMSPEQLNTKRLEERQLFGGGMFELTKGPCKKHTLIFARGTTEAVNIGSYVGYPLLNVLKKKGFTDLAVEGVTYGAGVMTNIFSTGGADGDGVKDANRLFKLAASKCPNTIILGGGYSQGAAIMHRGVQDLPSDVVAKIAGVALFGDTQSSGHIKNFPKEKSEVFCEASDGVCGGLLLVNLGHLSY